MSDSANAHHPCGFSLPGARSRLDFLAGVGVVLFSLILGTGSAVAQARIENVSSTRAGQNVVVTYDLVGEPGETYRVQMLLSMDGGKSYDYRPNALQGAVGEDVRVGKGKQIVWNPRRDFPDGLGEQALQFSLTVGTRGRSVLWYTQEASGGVGISAAWAEFGQGPTEGVMEVRGRSTGKRIEVGYGNDWGAIHLLAGRGTALTVLAGVEQIRLEDVQMNSLGPKLEVQLLDQDQQWPLSFNVTGKYQYSWGDGSVLGRLASYRAHRFALQGLLYRAFTLRPALELVPLVRYTPVRGRLVNSEVPTADFASVRAWSVESDTYVLPGLGVSIGSANFGVHFSLVVPVWWSRGEIGDGVDFLGKAPILRGGIHF